MADKIVGGVHDPQDGSQVNLKYVDQGDGSFAPAVAPVSGATPVVTTNAFDPVIIPAGWTAPPRMDDRGNQYTRQSWRDIAAAAYAAIIDNIGLGNLQLLLPLWEQAGGPFRSIVNRDKSFTGYNNVSPAQPGTLHRIVGLDGTTGYLMEDAVVANYRYSNFDTSMSGGTFLTAQQFVPTTTVSAGFVRAVVRKIGAPGGNIKMLIYSDSAGSPNAVISNGTSTTVALSAVTSSGFIGFSFATAPVLVAGTTYWLVLSYDTPSAIDASDLIEWQYDTAGEYGLPLAKYNGSTWTVTTGQSFGFDVYDNGLALGANANWTVIVGGQWLGGLGVNGYLIALNGPIGADPIFYLRRTSGNTYSATITESGGVADSITADITPTDYSIWAMSYSYTLATAKTSLYRNGVLLGTHNGTATTAPPLQAQPLSLGMQQGDYGVGTAGTVGNAWLGTVGPVILTNSLLTATQISQITNQLLALRRYQEAI